MSTDTRGTNRVAQAGEWLRDHSGLVVVLQWCIVVCYLVLIVVPMVLPLPSHTSSIINHFTLVAQFAFWGIWWPFVLLSVVLLGRSWCGIFCPEGTLTQWASRHGQGRAIPRWLRWSGWPFVAFCLTTIYGQLISVYQYPWATGVILGGSTLAAIAVGWLYGRDKRVWCRYLCPVSGVFHLLAKLSPWHYQVDVQAWRNPQRRTEPINCAPLLPLRSMQSAGDCQMCGRCSGYRGAMSLSMRSPHAEILSGTMSDRWQTRLIVFGLMGLVVGAFEWTVSPWYVTLKQLVARWLMAQEVYWPLETSAPWFILTNYPQVNDSLSWLDGALILLFMLGAALTLGTVVMLSLRLADGLLHNDSTQTRQHSPDVHKLAQGLIPAAGAGVFVGLSATTTTLLEHEGLTMHWFTLSRTVLFVFALLWSLWLLWKLTGLARGSVTIRLAAWLILSLGLAPFVWVWMSFLNG